MVNQIWISARLVVCAGVVISLLLLGGVASAEGGQKKKASKETALELNADHLGKSREALGSENAVIEDAEEEAAETKEEAECKHGKKHWKKHGKKHRRKHGEKHHGHEGCNEESCKARHHGRKAVARSYQRCVEVSVQAQNSLDESSRVCRVLFPKDE